MLAFSNTKKLFVNLYSQLYQIIKRELLGAEKFLNLFEYFNGCCLIIFIVQIFYTH